MEPVFELRGLQDLLQVYEDRLTITPKGVLGFLNKGLKGTKEIPFRSIVAVQMREGGSFVNGYLQFTISGGNESRGGVIGATRDENTLMFAKKSNVEAAEIKSYINGKVAAIHSYRPIPNHGKSLADQIFEIIELKEKGHLTEAEFAIAKARLLS